MQINYFCMQMNKMVIRRIGSVSIVCIEVIKWLKFPVKCQVVDILGSSHQIIIYK